MRLVPALLTAILLTLPFEAFATTPDLRIHLGPARAWRAGDGGVLGFQSHARRGPQLSTFWGVEFFGGPRDGFFPGLRARARISYSQQKRSS